MCETKHDLIIFSITNLKYTHTYPTSPLPHLPLLLFNPPTYRETLTDVEYESASPANAGGIRPCVNTTQNATVVVSNMVHTSNLNANHLLAM